MSIQVTGFDCRQLKYVEIGLDYDNFDVISCVKVKTQSDNLDYTKKILHDTLENFEILYSLTDKVRIKEGEIQLYQECGSVYMIYTGSYCKQAYDIMMICVNSIGV